MGFRRYSCKIHPHRPLARRILVRYLPLDLWSSASSVWCTSKTSAAALQDLLFHHRPLSWKVTNGQVTINSIHASSLPRQTDARLLLACLVSLNKTLLSNSVDPSVHPESSLNFRFFYHKHLGLVNLHPRPFRPILKPNILHVTLVYPPRSKKFTQYWSRRRTRHESVCHRWWVSSQI